jgi:hypothetical protein
MKKMNHFRKKMKSVLCFLLCTLFMCAASGAQPPQITIIVKNYYNETPTDVYAVSIAVSGAKTGTMNYVFANELYLHPASLAGLVGDLENPFSSMMSGVSSEHTTARLFEYQATEDISNAMALLSPEYIATLDWSNTDAICRNISVVPGTTTNLNINEDEALFREYLLSHTSSIQYVLIEGVIHAIETIELDLYQVRIHSITATKTVNSFLPVNYITGTYTNIPIAFLPCELTGMVYPTDATNKTITWSVKEAGSTGATITHNMLSATSTGTAIVTALIIDGLAAGTDYTEDFEINITSSGTLTRVFNVKNYINSEAADLYMANISVNGQYSGTMDYLYSPLLLHESRFLESLALDMETPFSNLINQVEPDGATIPLFEYQANGVIADLMHQLSPEQTGEIDWSFVQEIMENESIVPGGNTGITIEANNAIEREYLLESFSSVDYLWINGFLLVEEHSYNYFYQVRLHSITANKQLTPTPSLFCGGDGTAQNPFEICDAETLAAVATYVNAGNSTVDKYFVLTNDIDLEAYLSETGVGYNNGKGWIPIGTPFVSDFKGHFNGDGFVVKNLFINWIEEEGDGVGLFGSIDGATILNIGIENCDIFGFGHAGGLAGLSWNDSYIQNCYATGTVKVDVVDAGGLIGRANESTIKNCYATCDISGMAGAGGLIGIMHSTNIVNCYATGSVTADSDLGGIVSLSDGTSSIINCVAANSAVIANTETSAVNRIIGIYFDDFNAHNNYVNNAMIIQSNGVDLSVIDGSDVAGTGKPMATFQTLAFYNTANNWYEETAWSIADEEDATKTWRICNTQTLPYLQWEEARACEIIVDAETPTITTQPLGTTVCVSDGTYTMVVFANLTDGGTLTYQWYSNTTATNTGGTPINGATNFFYSAPMNVAGTFYYYVEVTNTNTGVNGNQTASINSDVAMFIVSETEIIETEATICFGGSYTWMNNVYTEAGDYEVIDTPQGGCPVTYILHLSVNPIFTETINASICQGDEYDFYGKLLTEAGTYYHTIVEEGECDMEVVLNLTFIEPVNARSPIITTHPQSANIPVGTAGAIRTLSIVASSPDGGALTYQWFSNTTASNTGGMPISGATGTNYNAPIDVVGTSYYYVVVTNTITGICGDLKTATLSSNVATITVTEPSDQLTITATAGVGGKITPAGVIKVSYGAAQIFLFTPNTGYKIESVLVDGINQPTAVTSGMYTFYNITASHTIHVTFVSAAITITATAGANGKITPAGIITITQGKSQSFIMTPNSGYKIETVLVNGVNQPAAVSSGMFTFTNVQTSQTIAVTFISKSAAPQVSIEEPDMENVMVYSFQNTVYIKTVETRLIASLPTVEIYDMTGRRIHQSSITDSETAITLNVTTGIYTVRIISSNQDTIHRKVAIMR